MYLREKDLVGDLEVFVRPAKQVTFGAGDPDRARALVEEIRSERPDEPLWTGVADVSTGGDGVTVRFAEGEDPALRPARGVDVACVLYGDDD